jgi:DNA repair protein RadC
VPDEVKITKQLKSAGETLGIRLLNHIIFNHKEYYSFLAKGELQGSVIISGFN